MQGVQPSLRTLLDAVPTRARLFEVARHFGVAVPQKGTKAELTAALAASDQLRLRTLIEWLGRDELRKACELHGLDSSSRARQQLAAGLLEAFGAPESAPPAALFGARVSGLRAVCLRIPEAPERRFRNDLNSDSGST